ncbi:MAG: radical SAM protein [Candidatus Omnitrophica bacterium]|nr:radical SAM protein [Candidatus Omnitrophota bacterium]
MKIVPSKIRLDASTVCQLKCPSCPNTLGLIAKNLGAQFLKFEDFKKIVDANPWIRAIELSNWGEIFLNPHLMKIAEYAAKKRVVLNAATGVNSNTVKEEMLEGVVKYQFGVISFSIDGGSPETYKIYRRAGDFKTVIANIRKINEFKVKYRSVLPKLLWQFLVFKHNEHEIPKAWKMARSLGMEFYLKPSGGGFSGVKNTERVRKMARLFSARGGITADGRGQRKCSQLWIQPQINSDGRVLGCCANYWGDYGNVFQGDLIGILNNERMNYARTMLLGRKKERKDIPCTQCSQYQRMKETNTWLFSSRKGWGAFYDH